MAASTPRTPAPERPPPPVPVSTPPPPLETPPSPSPSSQPGEEYHTPPPSLDASPREEPSFHIAPEQSPSSHDASPREEASLPISGRKGGAPTKTKSLSLDASPRERGGSPSDGRGGGMPPKSLSLHASPPREQGGLPSDGRGGAAPPAKSPTLSPVRLPPADLLPPPTSPSGRNGQEGGAATAEGKAALARPKLRLATGLVRTPSQGSLATKSPSPSPSPTPPSPLTPATVNNNKSAQSTPKRGEARKPPPPPPSPGTPVEFDPVEEDPRSPLRLPKAGLELDHHQHQHHHQQQQQRRQQHAGAAENGGDVPADVAAVAAVGERRALSVTLRLATAALSLAAFSVIASARTSGWAGDSYARHQQYRFIFRSMSSYYCSLFLDQVLAYLLMSASSAAASRNDLWVSRFGTDAFNRKISSALWLSFIGFLTLALNALISTANLFSMI